MLYHLRDLLIALNTGFRVFEYLTFRAMLAFFVTLAFTFALQPWFIGWFRRRYLGQPIREDGPESHQSKKGTPTMGGLVIIVCVVATTLLLADLTNVYVWATLIVTISYAILGFLDDYRKVTGQNSKGVSARTKLRWQILTAVIVVLLLLLIGEGFSTKITVPFLKQGELDLGWIFYVPFATLVIVGTSNAVNLTDGLDGLVIGPVMTVAFAYGVFAYITGHRELAAYLQLFHQPGSGEVAVVAAAIIAGGLGFLWFNAFPAQVFMGDVGSLALGGALGTLAVISKQELVLVIAGGVFVLEALSVIIQVGSFKIRGKRVFRMAPIHHHFELGGVSEPKIIVRCWIVSIVLAVLALITLKLR